MKKDAYISEVVSGVKSKSARREIAAELGSHIDELADFYLDRGYNETEAEEKAVSEMGDGEKVGYDMSRLHKTLPNGLEILLTALTFLSGLFFAFVSPLSIGDVNFVFHYSLFEETVFLLLCLSMSLYWKKYHCLGRLTLLALFFPVSVLLFAFYEIGSGFVKFCSPTVFYSIYLVLGRFDSIRALLNLYVSDLPLSFTVISIVFYIVISVVLVVNCFNRLSLKASKRISKLLVVLIVIIGVVFSLTFPLSFKYRNTNYNSPLAFGVNGRTILIAESDTPVPLSELTYEDMVMISFEDGKEPVYIEEYFSDSPLLEKIFSKMEMNFLKEFYYDEFVKYSIDNLKITYKPDKEYVYVYFSNTDELFQQVKEKYDERLWHLTDCEYHFSSTDGEIYPNSYINLTVEARNQNSNYTSREKS